MAVNRPPQPKGIRIDQPPTIHLGHETTTLEHKGIQAERDKYNREIKRCNEQRTAWKRLDATLDLGYTLAIV